MNRFQIVQEWLAETRNRDVNFRFAEVADAAFILSLRLDVRLNAYVSAVENDLGKQEAWLRGYKAREAAGEEFYFIIRVGETDVGTVRLYDFREDSFCWGSWLIRPEAPPKAAFHSMEWVYELAFGRMGFPNSHYDIRRANTHVWKFHESTGARLVSENELDRFYTLKASDYRSPLKRR